MDNLINNRVYCDVRELIYRKNWVITGQVVARTGSIYLECFRRSDIKKEWISVRIGDHKKVYKKWLIEYSIAPGDLWFEEFEEILDKPFGSVGDVF